MSVFDQIVISKSNDCDSFVRNLFEFDYNKTKRMITFHLQSKHFFDGNTCG